MEKELIIGKRASAILYNYLLSNYTKKSFFLPSNICPIVPLVFFKAKIPFQFIDISIDTLCIDENKVLKLLHKYPEKYSGIIFVRTYGVEDNFNSFFKKIKKINSNFIIIDDCCLCEASFDLANNEYVDVKLFSTGYAKYTDINVGGFAFIKKNQNYNKCKLDYNYNDEALITSLYKNSISKKKFFKYIDHNWLDTRELPYSIEEYQEIVFTKTVEIKKHKDEINYIYTSEIPNKSQLHKKFQNWRFNVIIPSKEIALKEIFKEKLFASSHYASISNIFSNTISPVAENLHDKIINLFNDKYFDKTRAYKLTKLINHFL